VVIHLGQMFPFASSGQPGRKAGNLISSLLGLALDAVCQASLLPDCW